MKQKLFHLAAMLAALLLQTLYRVRQIRTRCSLLITRCRSRSSHCVTLANIAEGTHLSSQGITYKADAAVTERFLLVKAGASPDSVAICGAADIPLGVADDEIAAADLASSVISVKHFNSDMTLKMVAGGALARGTLLEPSANGRVQALTTSAGNHYMVGQAMQAAGAAGDVIEVMPTFGRIVSP